MSLSTFLFSEGASIDLTLNLVEDAVAFAGTGTFLCCLFSHVISWVSVCEATRSFEIQKSLQPFRHRALKILESF